MTFQKGIPVNESESVKQCKILPNNTKNCTPPEMQTTRRLFGRSRIPVLNADQKDPLYRRYASQDINEYNAKFVSEMAKLPEDGAEPIENQISDPYGGYFKPLSGNGVAITPGKPEIVGNFTPPASWNGGSNTPGSGSGSGGSGAGGNQGSQGSNVTPGSTNSVSAAVNGLIVFFVLLAVGVIGVAIAFGIIMVLKKHKVNTLNRNSSEMTATNMNSAKVV